MISNYRRNDMPEVHELMAERREWRAALSRLRTWYKIDAQIEDELGVSKGWIVQAMMEQDFSISDEKKERIFDLHEDIHRKPQKIAEARQALIHVMQAIENKILTKEQMYCIETRWERLKSIVNEV